MCRGPGAWCAPSRTRHRSAQAYDPWTVPVSSNTMKGHSRTYFSGRVPMNVRGMYILGYRCLTTMNMAMNTSPTAYHHIRRPEQDACLTVELTHVGTKAEMTEASEADPFGCSHMPSVEAAHDGTIWRCRPYDPLSRDYYSQAHTGQGLRAKPWWISGGTVIWEAIERVDG